MHIPNIEEKIVETFTPEHAASNVITTLKWLWEEVEINSESFYRKFYELVVGKQLKPSDIVKIIDNLPENGEMPFNVYAEVTNSAFIFIATIYAVNAIEEFNKGKINFAWTLVLHAERYLGMAMGSNPAKSIPKLYKSELASMNASKSHERHRVAQEAAIKIYEHNIQTYNGLDDAAEKIVEQLDQKEKLIISFRKVRELLTEFHKKHPEIQRPKKKPSTRH